jgi:hypothetical protein
MMNLRRIAIGLLFAGAAACATAEPEKKPTGPDEFQGFAALRGEPREKKKAPAAEKGEGEGEGEADPKKGGGKKGEGEEDKTALTKEQVLGAIATAQKRVDGCRKKYKDPGIYVVEITIMPDGSCTVEPMRAPTRKEQPDLWTDVEGPLDGGKNPKSPTNKCLATALTQVKFPTFDGKPVVVTYPLILK